MKHFAIFILLMIVLPIMVGAKIPAENNQRFSRDLARPMMKDVAKALKGRDYQNDLISVNTALFLAQSSYLLGCVKEAQNNKEKKNSYSKCLNQAKAHVRKHLIHILDQKPSENTSQ